MGNTDDKYWAEYDGLQYAKHQLLTRYLGGWFPILSSWNGRVLYLDCHAGRGRHKTGHLGSPLLALNLLLGHRHRSSILSNTEVRFVFFEINESHCRNLQAEIASLGTLPGNVSVDVFPDDYEGTLRGVVDDVKSRGQFLAPAFLFVDPYGFKLSMSLLNDLLEFPKAELLINFMYRYVDMAMRNPAQARNMDALFGTSEWRKIARISIASERADATIALFADQLQAAHVSYLHMRGANTALKYVLFHASNHQRGRELMKEALWSLTPDGSFTAFERDNPGQGILIEPEPDLRPLESRLWDDFVGQQVRVNQVYKWLIGGPYLKKHLHKLLRDYRARDIVRFSDYGDRFAFGHNPLISFPAERPNLN